MSHAPVGAEELAQREATARNGKPDDPNQQGFFHSFYDAAIKPVVEQVKSAYEKGDLGASQADEMLRSFLHQAGEFAASGGDLRKLPVIGTGATATAQRMQDQWNAGNPLGMVGSAAGFVAPFAAGGNGGAAADTATATKEAIKASAAKNVKLVSLGVKLAARATGTNEVIGVLGKAASAAREDAAVPDATLTTRVAKGAADLARQKSILEGRAADLAYRDFPQDMAQPAAEFSPVPAQALPSGRVPGRPVPQAAPEPLPPRVPLWQRVEHVIPEPEAEQFEPIQATALPSGRIPGKPVAQMPAPVPDVVPRVPIWAGNQAIVQETPAFTPAGGPLPSGRIPGHLTAYDAQFEPTPVVIPATPTAEAPPAVAQVQAAPAAQVPAREASPALTPDDELEVALQKSIDMVRARKGGKEPGPVVSAANTELNEHLKQMAVDTGAQIADKARTRKAVALGKAAQSLLLTPEEIDAMGPEHWKALSDYAGQNIPSSKTIQIVKDLMMMGKN